MRKGKIGKIGVVAMFADKLASNSSCRIFDEKVLKVYSRILPLDTSKS